MSHKIIFENGEVSHRCVSHGRERVITIFHDDYVASPGELFLVRASLDVADIFVDRERHSVSRNGRIENDIRTCEFAVHAIECLNKLRKISSLSSRNSKVIISVSCLIFPGPRSETRSDL